jgi:5-methylcytosine-specific restriction endonuclease McrA
MEGVSDAPLPKPGSAELDVLPTQVHHVIYGYLYERRDDPPTMVEIRAFVEHEVGTAASQTDRRVRDLRDHFDIQASSDHRYKLTGWATVKKDGSRKPLSRRLRAEVLAPQRCAQCGRTPLDHEVVLVVDHKVPREWGGPDDISNLQPLCEECNAGKKAFYATYDEYADEIIAAAGHLEPHRRIGELLKAFHGDWVPSNLIGVVASMQQYQEDWQKRLRELRLIGWKIATTRTKDKQTGRTSTFYRVDVAPAWPEGPLRVAVAQHDPSNRHYQAPAANNPAEPG